MLKVIFNVILTIASYIVFFASKFMDAKIEQVLSDSCADLDWHNYLVSSCGADVQELKEDITLFIAYGITHYEDKSVTFIKPAFVAKKLVMPWTSLETIVKETVRHENRHVQQFVWLDKNGDKDAAYIAMFEDQHHEYGEGILEKDAHAYEKGEGSGKLDDILGKYKYQEE